MKYQDQLLTSEWKQKRERIIVRDKFTCQNCSNSSFDNNLRCGFAMNTDIDLKRNFNYFFFVNVNSPKDDYPDVFIKIHNDLLKKIFNRLPLFWIEYFDDLEKYEADICFISKVPLNKFTEIQRQLKTSVENKKSKSTSEVFQIPTIQQISEILPIPKILQIPENYKLHPLTYFNELEKKESDRINPHYSPSLYSLGKKLPISFAPKLNVHHKVYRENKKAWEYPDNDLITLCWSCHEQLHKNVKIACYSESGEYKGVLTPCSRCFGAGWFPEYKHVQNGICFRCWGKRYEEFLLEV